MALIDGAGDMGNPRVSQPKSAQAPKSLPKIAGADYCVEPDQSEDCDTDFPGGVPVVDSPGWAGKQR